MPADRRKNGWLWLICIAAVVLVMLSGILTRVMSGFLPSRQEKITALVTENLDALENSTQAFLSGKAAEPFGIQCTATVETLSDGGQFISYQTDAGGFGPQTSYYGFYWSPEGMVNFADYSLVEIPDTAVGLKTRADGDNWFYTEKITGNWYYFEWHF